MLRFFFASNGNPRKCMEFSKIRCSFCRTAGGFTMKEIGDFRLGRSWGAQSVHGSAHPTTRCGRLLLMWRSSLRGAPLCLSTRSLML